MLQSKKYQKLVKTYNLTFRRIRSVLVKSKISFLCLFLYWFIKYQHTQTMVK